MLSAKQLLQYAVNRISENDASTVLERSGLTFQVGTTLGMWEEGKLVTREGHPGMITLAQIGTVTVAADDSEPEPEAPGTGAGEQASQTPGTGAGEQASPLQGDSIGG